MLKRSLPWVLLVVVATAAAGVIWYLRHQVRAESLARENSEAMRETQLLVIGAQAKRMLQLGTIPKDTVDRELKTTTKVDVAARVTAKEVTTTGMAQVTADAGDSVRRATFQSDSTWHPYHGEISVALPRPEMLLPDSSRPSPPPQATIYLNRLGIAPISLRIKVRCSEDAGAGGVRKAYTTAQDVPEWASIDLGQPVADEDVCSPASSGLQFRLNAPTIAVIGGVGLLGLLAGILVF